MFISSMWDIKEPTHSSKRVGSEVSRCCGCPLCCFFWVSASHRDNLIHLSPFDRNVQEKWLCYASTTWNDLFCSCVDDVSIWWQMFNFVFLCPKRWFQFNSRIVRTHFSSILTLNNWKMIAETRSYIFRWRSRFRRRRVCLSSLLTFPTKEALVLYRR